MAKKLKGTAFIFGNQVEAQEASFTNFANWLIDKSKKEHNWPFGSKSSNTIAVIQKYRDYLIGLLCPEKGNKFYHSKKFVNGKLSLAPSDMGDDATEINFFSIRLDNFKGLYSYYSGSHSLSAFLDDLWKSYTEFVREKREVAEKGLDQNLPKKKKEEFLKDYSLYSKSKYSVLMTEDEFETFVKQFNRLEEVRITTLKADSSDDLPIKGIMKQCSKKYLFVDTPISNKIIGWLVRKYLESKYLDKKGKEKYTNGRITGYDKNNHRIFFDFNRNTKDYLDFDYDDIGSVDASNLQNHEVIKKMIENLEQNIIFR